MRPAPRSAVNRLALALLLVAPAILASACAPAPAQIVELDPAHGSVGVHADAPMTVIFDQGVVPESLLGALQITPSIPNCDMGKVFSARSTSGCYVQWGPGTRSFTVVHTDAPYVPQIHYTYALAPGVRSVAGVVNPLEHRWEVTSEIATSVASTSPSEGGAVPIDYPLVVSFSRDMVPETASSISLSPPITGTQVVQNTLDLGRFVVLAGSLLDPAINYTLSVNTSAIDAHHQHIAAPVQVHFHAVTTSERRALLLLGPLGGPASQVAVAPLSSHTPGDPVAQFQLLPASSSGYLQAALSPSGAQLAVVTNALAAPATSLEIVTLQSGTTISAPGPHPSLVSWSPDGNWLAYAALDGEHVISSNGGGDQVVASGISVTAVAEWARDSASMLLLVSDATGTRHLQMAQVGVDLHYLVPGVVGDITSAALASDGSALAYATGGDLWYERLQSFVPKKIGHSLTPLGFDSNGAVVAVSPAAEQLVRIDPATNSRTITNLAPASLDVSTISGSSDWRQLTVLAATSPSVASSVQAFVENADGSGATQITFAVAPTAVLGAQFVG